MSRKFVLGLLGTLILAANSASADGVIKDIKVEGLQRVSLGAVLVNLPLRVGDTLTREAVSGGIKKLYSTGNFDDVKFYDEGGVLRIVVRERPMIADIEYVGNDSMKKDQLDEVVKQHGIATGQVLDRTVLTEIEHALREYYNSAGHYSARINAVVTELPRNRVKIRFEFAEGRTANVRQINIIGNKTFTEEKLLSIFDTNDDLAWWNVFQSRNYNRSVLDKDLQALTDFYKNRGYARFKIKSADLSLSPDKKSVYITIYINEGDVYTVKGISFNGEFAEHFPEMEKLVPIEDGDVYSGQRVAHSEKVLEDFIDKYGYAKPKVTFFPVFNDEEKTVALNVNVQTGSRVYVRHININGNKTTRDVVIRRELRQVEGTWLSNSRVQQSKDRLNRLGFFDKVDITEKKADASSDTVDLDVKVHEKRVGSISGNIGYGSVSHVNFTATVAQDNILGTGNRAEFTFSYNKSSRKYEIKLRDPYFTVDGVALGIRAFYQRYEAGADDLIDYSSKSYGLDFSVGYPVNEINFVDFTVGWEHNLISQLQAYSQMKKFWKIYEDQINDDNEMVFNTYKIGAGWTRNELDKAIFPTSGNKESAGIEVSMPFSDLQYYKVNANASVYIPLSSSHEFVLAFRAKGAYGDGYGEKNGRDEILPFFENYTLGGDLWVRGFRNNSVGPKAIYQVDYYGNTSAIGTKTAVGGNAMYAATGEFIVPTPFVSENYKDQIRTSMFFDIGNVWDTKFDPDNYEQCMYNCDYVYDMSDPWYYRSSAGFSIQWISPVGPLTFTYAFPVKKRDGDRMENFSFSMGRTF